MMKDNPHRVSAKCFRTIAYGWSALRLVVLAFAAISGAAVLAIMAVTCVDVALRAAGRPFTGAYDLVQIAGAIAIAGALPYTTAVKGHVAVEFFFQKLNRAGRILLDTVCRLAVMALFSVFSWQCVLHGNTLKRTGQISLTLGIPLFWLSYVIAAACLITTLVVLYNLLHPGREMIKP